MNRMLGWMVRFGQFDRRQKIKVLLIVWYLFYFSIYSKIVPLRLYYQQYFGTDPSGKSTDWQPFAGEIRQLSRIAQLLPWKISCLAESMATKKYLSFKGIDITIFVGARVINGELKAHAWYHPLKSDGFTALNIK